MRGWELPPIDLWAVYPTGRTLTTKARLFTAFVEQLLAGRGPAHSPAE